MRKNKNGKLAITKYYCDFFENFPTVRPNFYAWFNAG